MSMPRAVIGVLAFLFATTAARPASAVPFTAGDVLGVTFDLTSGLAGQPSTVLGHAIPQDTDVFAVSVFVGSATGVNTFTLRLFNGDHLLGASTISAGPVLRSPFGDYAHFYFTSPTSPFGSFTSPQGAFVVPTVIDFSSFQNGSINGAVEFTINAGQIVTRHHAMELFLGHSNGSQQAYGVRVFPHGESPTPEPASLLLMGTGTGALALRLRRRR